MGRVGLSHSHLPGAHLAPNTEVHAWVHASKWHTAGQERLANVSFCLPLGQQAKSHLSVTWTVSLHSLCRVPIRSTDECALKATSAFIPADIGWASPKLAGISEGVDFLPCLQKWKLSWYRGRTTWYQLESGDRNQGKISHFHQNLLTDVRVYHPWSRSPWPPDTLSALLFSLFPTRAVCTCYLTDPSTPMGLLCTTPTDLSPRQYSGLLRGWPGPSWLTMDKQA